MNFRTPSHSLYRVVAAAFSLLALGAVAPALTPASLLQLSLAASAAQQPKLPIVGGATSLPGTLRQVHPPLVGSENAAGGLSRNMEALGDRIRVPGKERTELTGQVTDGSGRRAGAQVTLQTPGLVALNGFRAGDPVKFDGKPVVLPMSREEEGMVETFTADLPEGLFAAVRAGGSLRLLGLDFGPENETPGRNEPHYDIYELTYPADTNPNRSFRVRRFFFDSDTGLLARTTYTVNDIPVETRFADWRKVDGSMYPGRVERYEHGGLVFSFRVTGVTPGPQSDAAAFQR